MKADLIPLIKSLSFLFIFCLNDLNAQSNTRFDHQALVVKDLQESVSFYSDVLGARKIEDPTGNPKIDWLGFSDAIQMHLIEGNLSDFTPNKSIHMAFKIEDLKNFMKKLESEGIPFENWPGEKNTSNIRPDGVHQIYLQDPNGYWIEVNDNPS